MTVHKSGDQKPNLVVVAAESLVGYRAKKIAISRKSCKIETLEQTSRKSNGFHCPEMFFSSNIERQTVSDLSQKF